MNHFYGTLSTGDHQVPENYLWRIVCKTNGTGSVIVIIRKFSIAPGEHLHVKTRKISGCNVRHWLAFHIQKRSFLVALGFNEANSSYPNSSTSTFEMSYVCIGELIDHYMNSYSNSVIIIEMLIIMQKNAWDFPVTHHNGSPCCDYIIAQQIHNYTICT